MTRGNTGEGTQCVDVVAFRRACQICHSILRALFPLVGIALGVAVFIAVRVTNISTLGAFARTVDAIAGRAGLEITGRGHCWTKRCCRSQAGAGRGGCGPLVLADVVVPEAGGAVLLVAGIDVVSDRAVRDYTFHGPRGTSRTPCHPDPPQAVVLSERFAQRYGFRLGSADTDLHLQGIQQLVWGGSPSRRAASAGGILQSWILRRRCCSIGLDA